MPKKLFEVLSPIYHWKLAFLAALWYRFPSKNITVIAVTGTKGKSSTTEILNAILEEAGYKTALSNTIRYKVGNDSHPNLFKMSMPGRFFAQRLIRKAVDSGCQFLIMEMTSQGALQYRHRFIKINTLVFTNISPEHIEAHGSYENYLNSKLELAKHISRSGKSGTTIIANSDDKESQKFLACEADNKITYGIQNAEPYSIEKEGLKFTLNGQTVSSQLSGIFNLYNIISAVTTARSFGVDDKTIIRAIEKISEIPGRVQKIKSPKGFEIVVDYAHTPDSLEKFYKVFDKSSGATGQGRNSQGQNICILGGTGGGRDTWKRAEMGRLAEKYCSIIFLTNEDPYDEDPDKIVADVALGIKNKKPQIIMDRRLAIREAIRIANAGDSILITGKGTDPYIMGPNGTKTPWSDYRIAEEELLK
jgi:UDP-N-acetylmuramoyl-L-alanyl-D-glutamate--2,6-diaminopimelate ligase